MNDDSSSPVPASPARRSWRGVAREFAVDMVHSLVENRPEAR